MTAGQVSSLFLSDDADFRLPQPFPDTRMMRAFELMGVGISHEETSMTLEGVVRTLPATAVRALSRSLGAEVGQVCALVGVSERTLSRRETLQPAEGDRLYRIALVAAEASLVFAAHPRGQTWLCAPHAPPLSPTPLVHLDTEIGVARVRAALGEASWAFAAVSDGKKNPAETKGVGIVGENTTT